MTAQPSNGPPGNLRFLEVQDAEAMSRHAAAIIESRLRRKPELLLCAAAGSSPRRTYALLAELASVQPGRFDHMRVIKVDEWGGLGLADPATCESDLRTHLLGPLRISPDRYQGFESHPAEPERECERLAQWLARNGPIDLCVLGVGANGHIAMNEPGEALCPGPHVAELAPSSLEHPMLAVSGAKPSYGLTLGMSDILHSKTILLLAGGPRKRPIVERLQQPAITARFPVSFLWLHHQALVLYDKTETPERP